MMNRRRHAQPALHRTLPMVVLFLMLVWGATGTASGASGEDPKYARYHGWKVTGFDVVGMPEGMKGDVRKGLAQEGRWRLLGGKQRPPFTSRRLAEDLARVLERNMSGDNAWHVQMDEQGKLSWVSSEQTLYEQPARDAMQRVMNVLMKIGPRDQY